MATVNYSFNLPSVGGDDDVWGDLLNANWSQLDGILDTLALKSVTLTAGDGLNGGGNLGANRTFAVDGTVARTARQINSGDGLSGGGDLSANRTLSVDSSVVRTSRTITAGTGLTGGGTLAANRTINIANGGVGSTQLAADQRMTTANVLGQTAGAASGAVGTYAFAWRNSTATPPAFGATVAGSQLRPAGFTSADGVLVGFSDRTTFNSNALIHGSSGTSASSFSGTWRCMGEAIQNSAARGNYPHTLWLRIS